MHPEQKSSGVVIQQGAPSISPAVRQRRSCVNGAEGKEMESPFQFEQSDPNVLGHWQLLVCSSRELRVHGW
jgi:hypothetical protein